MIKRLFFHFLDILTNTGNIAFLDGLWPMGITEGNIIHVYFRWGLSEDSYPSW